MSFQAGLSGLDAANTYLDVVGNNIANANTVGFKGATADFADVYATTLVNSGIQIGLGTRTQTVSQNFDQGTTTTTNNPLDIAIEGNGFFQLSAPGGSLSYTRNGQFQLDRNGFIVNGGSFLDGFIANANGQIATGGTPVPIQVQTANIIPQATGGSNLANAGLTLGVNLDATKSLISQGTQNVNISGVQLSSSASPGNTQGNPYQIRVIDPTGQFHTLQIQLTNVQSNAWQVSTSLDGGPFTNTGSTITFNALGQPLSGITQTASYSIPSPSPAYGNTQFNFSLNFSGITQPSSPTGTQPTLTTDDTAYKNAAIDIFNANLNSAAQPGTTQSYSSSVTDPNGVVHPVVIQLQNTASNTWQMQYTIDPNTSNSTTVTSSTPLVFNSKGLLIGGSPIAATLAYPSNPNDPTSTASPPSPPMAFNINLSGVTQTTSATTVGSTESRNEPPVSASDPTTFTSSTSATVYDSQGVPHNLTFYFTKVGVNTWETQTSLDGATPVLQPGYVTFGSNGTLSSSAQIAYSANIVGASGAQTPLAFNISLNGSTQLGAGFAVNTLSQDGYTTGSLTGLTINANGTIQGNYSNGQNRTVGQISLYNFADPQGLAAIGGNQWVATYASGQAIQGTPGSGDFGSLQSGAVENSNIDLTKELVNMITAQRAYQANAETIKTEDQVLQTITSLR